MRQEDMSAALERRQPTGAVPIWELEFHAWDQVTGQHVVLGSEFCALSPAEQGRALEVNAEILLSAACELDYAALTVPGNYWEIAPGEPAFYWLPPEARVRQIELLQRIGGGVMGEQVVQLDSSEKKSWAWWINWSSRRSHRGWRGPR